MKAGRHTTAVLLGKIALIVLVVEGLTMAGLYRLPEMPGPLAGIAGDALLLALFSTPLIYFFAIRPFLLQANKALSNSDRLESRVQSRTSELQEAVHELSRKEQFLAMALDNLPGALVLTDSDLRVVICSRRFSELYHAPPGYLNPGSDYRAFIRYLAENGYYGDGDVEELIAKRIESVRNPAGERFEDHRPDGAVFSVTRNPVEQGWTITIVTDITELKRTEQELRKSDQRLRAINNTVQAGIVMANVEDGEIFFANAEAEAILGINVGKMFVKGWEDVFTNPREWEEFLVRFSYEGHVKHQEMQIKRPDGQPAWIFASLTSVSGEDRNTLLMSFIDITEHKRTEEHLKQAQKMDALGSLAGGIAHDLNNMLLPILTLTGMTARELPEDSSGRERLEKVVLAAEKASDLINRILVFSRQDLDVQKKEIDLYDTVKDAMYLLHATLPSTINLKENLDENVGRIFADQAQIQTVLLNLASNSIDAIAGRVGDMEITLGKTNTILKSHGKVRERTDETWAELSVSDTGCGMSEETMGRVFDPFFTTKDVGEGTGIGLSMVHGIITSQGGSWDVISSPGQGTTFYIYLPLLDKTAAGKGINDAMLDKTVSTAAGTTE